MPNRAERRKIAKKMTPQYVEKIVKEEIQAERYEQKQRELELIEIMITMVAYTLNYKLNLGKKRLPKIMDYIMFNIDSFRTGELTRDDYEVIKEIVQKKGVKL